MHSTTWKRWPQSASAVTDIAEAFDAVICTSGATKDKSIRLPMQVLGMFPLTSFAVQSARMVMTSVPVWEIAASLVFLVITVWLLRYVGGRIFAAGMLIYGKEPSFREIIYWFKRA